MNSESKNLDARIAGHPFLAGMSPRHIELLAESASIVQFDSGQAVFRTGETASGFYLIESGSVDLEGAVAGQAQVRIDIVSAGEPLGWSWLFAPYLWQYDARTTRPTVAIFFDRNALRKSCDCDLTLGHELFHKMSEVMVRRLQASRAKMIELLHGTT